MIPIPVYVSSEFYASLQGSAVKHTKCEFCGKQYVYVMRRIGQGKVEAHVQTDRQYGLELARNDAVGDSLLKMRRSCDTVPCPKCGKFQRQMIRQERLRRLGWSFLAWLGLGPTVLVASMFIRRPWEPGWVEASLYAAGSAAAFLYMLYSLFRPYNSAPERWIGKSRGILREDFERLRKEQNLRVFEVGSI